MQRFISTDGLIHTGEAVRCLVRGCASPGSECDSISDMCQHWGKRDRGID